MSTLIFDLGKTTADGVGQVSAHISCRPVKRGVDGETVILRNGFSVNYAGTPLSVELAPMGAVNYWHISISSDTYDNSAGIYIIPDGTTNFTDLEEIDPSSIAPDAEPDPAWWIMAKSTVSTGEVDPDGDLILSRTDGVKVNAGRVKGADGAPGAKGDKGDKGDAGERGAQGVRGEQGIQGEQGLPGADGVDGEVSFEYANANYARKEMADYNNVRLGQGALAAITSDWLARNNNAFGIGALTHLAQGRYNDAFGLNALYYLDGTGNDPAGTAATRNSAFGSNTQRFNKTGYNNVSFGRNSLQCNVGGANNVAFGAGSMAGLAPLGLDGIIINGTPVDAQRNVAIGVSTLDQTGGGDNVALGYRAAVGIKLGYGNVAVGSGALEQLETDVAFNGKVKETVSQSGTFSANGSTVTLTIAGHTVLAGDIVHTALSGQERQFLAVASVTADTITCTLPYAVAEPLSGTSTIQAIIRTAQDAAPSAYNIAVGYGALSNLRGTPAVGSTGNVALGFGAGQTMADGTPATQVRNSVMIGRNAAVSGDAQVQLGNTSMTVYAQQAIQIRSDERDKADIRDTVLGLDFINELRPVDYKLDVRQDYFIEDDDGNIIETPERDGSMKRERYHHGLIAQDVERVISSGYDFGGYQDHTVNGGSDIRTIAYEELVAPLIKAVQELSAEIKILKGE